MGGRPGGLKLRLEIRCGIRLEQVIEKVLKNAKGKLWQLNLESYWPVQVTLAVAFTVWVDPGNTGAVAVMVAVIGG